VREALLSGLRRVGALPFLLPVTALVTRGLTVRETPAFVAREALRRRGMFLYTLRESGLRVALRHRTGDVVTVGEVWRNRDYDPPAEVDAAIGAPRRVIDLGGNIGLFALHALGRWPTAAVVSYEPDPVNAAVARRSLATNALEDRWEVVEAAAGNAAGSVRFAGGQDALSHVVADGETSAASETGTATMLDVPLLDVLPAVGDADLVKIDIEGGEWDVLGDPRFAAAPPRALVLEYHPRGCPTTDPHVAIRDLIDGAGLRHQDIWRRDDGHGMLWAWRA
jgi:FkbM family methyltransferase